MVRGQSLAAFKEMLQRGDYVVLDTETTGIRRAEVVQIALVDSQGQTLLDTLVKPVESIPRDATAIHHITDSMVVDAPPWAEVSPQVETLLRNRDVVVYNAVFDRKIMHMSAEIAGMPKVDWKTFSRWWCAMEALPRFTASPVVIVAATATRSWRWRRVIIASRL